MPKILMNVENIIFKSAKELFYEKGYEQVNMKDISERSNIAVGTLYNYYSNKKELYLSVLEKSWEDTFEKLELIFEKDIGRREKIKYSICTIYDEMVDRKCMGIQVRKSKNLKNERSILALEKKIKLNLKKIFENASIAEKFQSDENILAKTVYTILINATMLMDYYPDYREDNIEYLYHIIVSILD